MSVNFVVITKRAEKEIEKVPSFIKIKLRMWVADVERLGLHEVQKIPGFHDEPLKGNRKGQRSIRLSRAYRAIYRLIDEKIVFVLIEEVNKHDY